MSKGGMVLALVWIPQEGRPYRPPADLLRGVRPGRLPVLCTPKGPAWERGLWVRWWWACPPGSRLRWSGHVRQFTLLFHERFKKYL